MAVPQKYDVVAPVAYTHLLVFRELHAEEVVVEMILYNDKLFNFIEKNFKKIN